MMAGWKQTHSFEKRLASSPYRLAKGNWETCLQQLYQTFNRDDHLMDQEADPTHQSKHGSAARVLFDSGAHEALHELALEEQKADEQRRGSDQRGRVDHRPFDPAIRCRENRQSNC